jgi:hypothetical protein
VKKLILHDFDLEEISAVDIPAQTPAKMSIIKRNESTDRGNNMSTDNQNTVELDALKKQVSELSGQLADAQKMAGMSDAEKQYMTGMKDDEKKAFTDMKPEDRKKRMEMSKSMDESIEVNGVVLTKSALGADMFSVIKSQQAQLEKQEQEVRKAREMAITATFVRKASEQYSHVPGTNEELGMLLRETADISKGAQDTLASVLEALEKSNAKAFVSKGHTDGADDEGVSPIDKLDSIAKSYATENNVDYATAYSVVIEQNADLYQKSLN